MNRFVFILPLLAMGCADIPLLNRVGGGSGDPAPTVDPAVPTPVPTGATVTSPLAGPATRPEALDTVSEAEKAQARDVAASAPAGGELGTVTVALGSPAETGLWVKSALVTQDTPGTVRTSDGDAIAVTLRPLGGAGGPQISLSALQALGLPLVGLFPVTLATTG
ncbi:hypothetical protein [Jannaschia donghaensis]|uniref:D-galactarate dehydratase n=1 Tax=Jannaschia donghaensis TaxID=420998 RepID=A0A0M6YQ54_9RHOB|nr:hypothetical protein [Jannaschia donghaensis]CTQ51136.1 hypothetical protein JDO7802_03174 [Jannaschia donghaensis]